MTNQQIVEVIRQAFPEAGETEVRIALRQVTDDFCRRSRILRQSVLVSGTFTTGLADLGTDGLATPEGALDPHVFTINVYEPFSSFNNSTVHRLLYIEDVQWNGESLPRLPLIDYRSWWTHETVDNSTGESTGRLVIGVVSAANTSGKSALGSSVSIRVRGVYSVASGYDWTAGASLPVPVEYRMGLAYGVMKHFALIKGRDGRLASLYFQEYENAVRQAMARSNVLASQGSGAVKLSYF